MSIPNRCCTKTLNLNVARPRVSLKKLFLRTANGSREKEMPERSINMKGPIIACDVSKGESHIQGFLGPSCPFGKPMVVRHVKSELRKIRDLAKQLRSQTNQDPSFVFEYTGIYHECVARYVESQRIRSYAISPLESAKARKMAIRPTKTDSLDCANIAMVFYAKAVREFRCETADLKALSRRKKQTRNELIRQRCIYRRYIDLIWPCFDGCADPYTQSSMAIVEYFQHPYRVKRMSSKQVAAMLESNVRVSHKRSLSLADRYKDYASDSVSGVDVDSKYVETLRKSLRRIRELEREMGEINGAMEARLRRTDAYILLGTIPGFGENILLQVAAEIGDHRRFETAKQFTAFCGLDPSVLQSGTSSGEHYSITRKGNSILRSCLYLAFQQMLTQGIDNQITRFYFKKKSSGLTHKVAAVAAVRKLACCVFGMLSNGTCFETK